MSRSLAYFKPLVQSVNSRVLRSGFVAKGSALSKEVGEVIWFFNWGKPYDDKGRAFIDPVVGLSSPAFQSLIFPGLRVGPDSMQLSTRIATLHAGFNPPGFSLEEARWEESARAIIQAFEGSGLDLLNQVVSTQDMVNLLRLHPAYSNCSSEKNRWNCDVWEGKIDPKVSPFRPTPLEPLFTEEMIRELKATLKS